ncbi:winged helix-turn-helix transcriptional regulator [Nocardia sp. CA-084685]|uniref:winged helix-turn-helix transcriptional regulator n=1 Tax=Nocardia sp. CA-084685 TaxID=3239970 RepID=UPI003D9693C8
MAGYGSLSWHIASPPLSRSRNALRQCDLRRHYRQRADTSPACRSCVDALDGFTRFDEFEANLGIAPNMLTLRLRALSDDGLLERVQYSTKPARYEYIVTEKRRDLRPVIVALYLWTTR